MAREAKPAAGKVRAGPGEDKIRARNIAKILSAAVELFSRKGFDGVRIAEIAEASGLPKANLYYYFATKEEIYISVLERVLLGWDKAFEEIRPNREPADALPAYVAAKLDYSRRHPTESRLFANEMLRGGGFVTAKQKQHMMQITHEKAEVIEEWIRQGKMAAVDAGHLFILLWSATQFYADFAGVASSALNKGTLGKLDFELALKTITQTILGGLGIETSVRSAEVAPASLLE